MKKKENYRSKGFLMYQFLIDRFLFYFFILRLIQDLGIISTMSQLCAVYVLWLALTCTIRMLMCRAYPETYSQHCQYCLK